MGVAHYHKAQVRWRAPLQTPTNKFLICCPDYSPLSPFRAKTSQPTTSSRAQQNWPRAKSCWLGLASVGRHVPGAQRQHSPRQWTVTASPPLRAGEAGAGQTRGRGLRAAARGSQRQPQTWRRPPAPPTLLSGTGLLVLPNGAHEDTQGCLLPSPHRERKSSTGVCKMSLWAKAHTVVQRSQKDGPQQIKAGPVNTTACTGPDHHSPSFQTQSWTTVISFHPGLSPTVPARNRPKSIRFQEHKALSQAQAARTLCNLFTPLGT